MTKGKGSFPSPAEDYLSQVGEESKRSRHRYGGVRIPSRSDPVQPKWRYQRILNAKEDTAGQAIRWLGILVIGGAITAAAYNTLKGVSRGDPYFLAVFIVGGLAFLIVTLAARDASRPPK